MKKLLLMACVVGGCKSVDTTQTCSCESNFQWVQKTFEENDAGAAMVIAQKGTNAYNLHNAAFMAKARATTDGAECTQIMRQWLLFFRKGHHGINYFTDKNADNDNSNDDDIRRHYADWETYPYDKEKFYKHIDSLTAASIEGVWQTDDYTIGIVKTNCSEYTGFIIKADSVYWTPTQVKLKIDMRKPKNTTYFMRNHSTEVQNSELLSNNYLRIGDIAAFQRVHPVFPKDSMDDFYRLLYSQKPYVERISSKTMLLRIPTFSGSLKEINDVIAANKKLLTSTENLIIDIRDNGGGTDANFYAILPLLATNPMRIIWLEHLSTKLNNQRMLKFAENTNNQDYKKWYDTLENHLGQFVNLMQQQVVTRNFDTIYPYPKNVGIIINENNASAAEEFILEARQSKKVKLFGHTTFGAIDISNMHSVRSPCGDYELWYCLTKRLWLQDVHHDDIGIQPDYYIDRNIPPHKWVEFVRRVLE